MCISVGLCPVRFDRHADEEETDCILDDGIQTFYAELGVDTQVRRYATAVNRDRRLKSISYTCTEHPQMQCGEIFARVCEEHSSGEVNLRSSPTHFN